MESLQKLLSRISTQLRDLNVSQRLTILLGGLLVAISLLWLLQWAASPEMVPLLDQEFGAEELARVERGLARSNTSYKLVDGKIHVPADANPHVILAQLQLDDSLPADTSIGFTALVKESNPWISQAEHERRWAVALKSELEKVLSQLNGVRSATVFLPMGGGQRRFARVEPAQSASVTLLMAGDQPVTRELALAAAKIVAGAVRGLALKNVEVVDGNGTTALDWESEMSGATAIDRQRRKHEREIRAKILAQLPDPRARVQTQVELELTDQQVQSETPGKSVETSRQETVEETRKSKPSAQPGVQPNVGVAAGGRVADEYTTKETSTVEMLPGVTRKKESTPAGGIKEIAASVYISRSYLEGIFRQAKPDAEPPTEDDIEVVFNREKPRIVRQVTKLVRPQAAEQVAVDWYYDTTGTEAATIQASSVEETMRLVRQYGPQSGLALLALISLAMMLRMSRKTDEGEAFGLEIGLPQEAIEAAKEAARDAAQAYRKKKPRADEDQILGEEQQAIGQAAMTEGVLVAQEVDEKTVQTNKMLEQVAQVVEGDVESASGLLEQWIRRSDSYGS